MEEIFFYIHYTLKNSSEVVAVIEGYQIDTSYECTLTILNLFYLRVSTIKSDCSHYLFSKMNFKQYIQYIQSRILLILKNM